MAAARTRNMSSWSHRSVRPGAFTPIGADSASRIHGLYSTVQSLALGFTRCLKLGLALRLLLGLLLRLPHRLSLGLARRRLGAPIHAILGGDAGRCRRHERPRCRIKRHLLAAMADVRSGRPQRRLRDAAAWEDAQLRAALAGAPARAPHALRQTTLKRLGEQGMQPLTRKLAKKTIVRRRRSSCCSVLGHIVVVAMVLAVRGVTASRSRRFGLWRRWLALRRWRTGENFRGRHDA